MIYQVMLFSAAARLRKIQEAAGRNDETGAVADAERLTGLLREFSPVCCLIPEQRFQELIDALGAGPLAVRAWRESLPWEID